MRIDFVSHVISSDLNNLHNRSALIQFQLDTLEERRDRAMKNGSSRKDIRRLEKRIERLEKKQQVIDKEILG